MKCLILLALAAVARAQLPVDTPEVAAAKAAHFAEVQRAAVAVGAPAWYPYLGHRSVGVPSITADGFVADTPEVAAAKEAHFFEKARAATRAAAPVPVAAPVAYTAPAYYYPYTYSAAPVWHGPLAVPVVTPEGFLADTPEVAAARAAHLAEVARAEAQA